jgi:hypothetical protein
MEFRENDFHELKLRVDKLASELDKKNSLKAVNTKWMITVGALILAALGYTSFIQIPKEAAKAAREQVGEDTIKEKEKIMTSLRETVVLAEEIRKEFGEINLEYKGGKYHELEMNKVDKVLFVDDKCKVGVIRSAKNSAPKIKEEPAICVCQDTEKGKGWVCFN